MLNITNAKYIDGFKIYLEFNDQKKGEVDLQEFIETTPIKPFKRLQDVKKFQNFKVDYTLIWDEDLDLAPEYLYFKAFENDNKLKDKFIEWGYVELWLFKVGLSFIPYLGSDPRPSANSIRGFLGMRSLF